MNVNIDKLIQVVGLDNVADILRILTINLDTTDFDYSIEAEWQCSVEGKWWAIEARQKELSECYSVRWTTTAEAGVDDVEIVEHYADGAENKRDLREWLEGIAKQAGSSNGKVMFNG